MPDTQETKLLKDINRHLAHMDKKEPTGSISPAELNKNVQDVLGNFTSLVSSQLKENVRVTNKALSDAFGNLKGFDVDAQTDILDEVVDELQTNNRFMEKSEHNDFLAEQERETDLNINRRTNDLLEDLVDKEDDAAALSKSESSDTKSFLSGGMGGLFGGLFAGKSIRGLFGAIKGAGKKIFFPLLLAGAGVEFLRGWAEAGKDASIIDKFNSGISLMASDLTFGLVSKKFFTDALENIEGAIGKAWRGFTKNWDEFVNGKITGPDFFANILSGLSLGTLSAEQLKTIGQQIEDGMVDVVATIVHAVTTGIVEPLMESLSKQFAQLFSDPVQFFRDLWDKRKMEEKEEMKAKIARANQLMKDEGLSEAMAMKQAAWEATIDKQGFFTRTAGKVGLAVSKKFGAFSETQAEFDIKAAEKQAALDLKAKQHEAMLIRQAKDKKERLAFRYGGGDIKAEQKELSGVGQEGIKQFVDNQRALTEFKKTQEEGGGNAMQINNNTSVANSVDTQTENDDRFNLLQSSRLAH